MQVMSARVHRRIWNRDRNRCITVTVIPGNRNACNALSSRAAEARMPCATATREEPLQI